MLSFLVWHKKVECFFVPFLFVLQKLIFDRLKIVYYHCVWSGIISEFIDLAFWFKRRMIIPVANANKEVITTNNKEYEKSIPSSAIVDSGISI